MIWRKDIPDLKRELKETSKLIKTTTDREKKFALVNYANCIENAIYSIDEDADLKDIGETCTERDLSIYDSICEENDEKLCKNYIETKSFHNRFLEDILYQKESLGFEWDENNFQMTEYSESDFLEILYNFLKSIGQENLFYQIIQNGQIYSQKTDSYGNVGSTLFNPVTRKSIVFIRKPNLTLKTMGFVSHELGHVFDHNNMDINVKSYNEYLNNSFYAEVISRLFEKLLIDYIITNNIDLKAAKYMLQSYDEEYYYNQFNAFLLSTLNNNFYIKKEPIEMDTETFYNQFNEYFDSIEEAKVHQEISGNFSLNEVYAYSYADIIATFLFDEFKKNGFYNKAFKDFMKRRFTPFDRRIFDDNDWSPKKFGKLYQKEMQLLTK